MTNSRSMRFCSAPKSIRVWRELETWLKRRVTGSGRQGLEVIDEPSTCIPEITGVGNFLAEEGMQQENDLDSHNRNIHGHKSTSLFPPK